MSCIYIMRHYFQSDKNSSFAFIGANSVGEDKSCTKRFRFYRTMVNTYFGTETFEHRTDERNSAYLLLRKASLQSGNIKTADIESFFRNIYILDI